MNMTTAEIVTGRKSNWRIELASVSGRTTRFAAFELRNTLERMTRVSLPIDDGRLDGSSALSLVEDSTLSVESFRITIESERVEIRGNGCGVLYGVYALLARLGCRYVIPGDDCVPDAESLSLQSGVIEESPSVAQRMVRLIDPLPGEDPAASLVAQVDWCAKNRINWLQCSTGWIGTPTYMNRDPWTSDRVLTEQVAPNVLDRGIRLLVGCHSFFHWCPPEEFFETHPEYYSFIDGKRQPVQLCVTNPQVEQTVAERIISLLDRCPEVGAVDLSPMDGDEWCNCERCLAADEPAQMAGGPFHKCRSRSRSLYAFVDRVAQRVAAKHPDRIVATMAYVHYTEPPTDYTPTASNLAVILTWYWNCATHALDHSGCEIGSYFWIAQQKWAERLRGKAILFAADYHYGMSAWNLVPWPALRLSARNWKLSAPLGVNAFAFQHYKADPILYRIVNHVWARFVWDLAGVDDWPELWRGACEAHFGPAAGQRIAQYQLLIEGRAEELEDHLLPSAELFLTRLIDHETYGKLEALAGEAAKLSSGSVHARRIAQFLWQHGMLQAVWQTSSHWQQAQRELQDGNQQAARPHLEKTVQCGLDAMQRWPHNPKMISLAAKAVSAAMEKLGRTLTTETMKADDLVAAKMSDLVTQTSKG